MEWTKERRIYRSTLVQRGFLGYHPALRIRNGEWFSEWNLSSGAYPLLTVREPRKRVRDLPVSALGSLNGLCYVAGDTFYYGEHSLKLSLAEGEKTLIPFGAYMVIAPDMIWVNTMDHSHGYCETEEQFQGDIGILWCDGQGEPLEGLVSGDTAPENREQYWLDTAQEPPVLKAFSPETGMWYKLEHTFLRLSGDGIGAMFPAGSRVLLGGNRETEELIGPGLHEILASDRDYLVLEGSIDDIRKELREQMWSLRCPVPKMDFLLCHENRLWGCRYGEDHNGAFVNEIYASALGDLTAWYSFRGLSSDSYTASLGSEGPFTGAAVVGGYPVFFKENSLCKIYGSRPSNFQIRTLHCTGVARGSERSTALTDMGLVYLGRDGFYVYDGSLPAKISDDLEGHCYSNAVAGVRGSLYYGDVLEDGIPVTLCYDMTHKLWHRESPMGAAEMVTVGDVLYYRGETPGICAVGSEEGIPVEHPVSWEAVSGILREDESKDGCLTGLRLRLSMEPGSSLSIYGEYDSSGAWEPLGTLRTRRLGSEEIPLRVKRCDHLRLKLKGRGNVTVHTLTMIMEG